MPKGGNSHDRRRKRRAAMRNGAEGPQSALHSVSSLAELDAEDDDFTSKARALADRARAAELTVQPVVWNERVALAMALAAFDEAMPPCANCDHGSATHEGDDNMGACTVEGCDCDGYMPPEESDGDAESEMVNLGVRIPDEVIEHAAVVLARGAELVDLADGSVGVGDRLLERMTFRLENIELVEPLSAAAGEAQLPESTVGGGFRWVADAVLEGTLTDDGRAFAPGALTWRELPLTLGAMLDTPHADVVTESRAAGRIDTIYRAEQILKAEGVFDTGDWGQEVARMVDDGTLRGISVDVAVKASEIAPKADFFDEDGVWREERIETTEEGEDLLDILFGTSDQEMIFVVTEGVIGAITVCPFPAFADARIEIAASLTASKAPAVWTMIKQSGMVVTAAARTSEGTGEPMIAIEVPADGTIGELTASAEGLAPLKPPVEWFNDPQLDEPTALTVTDDGQIYGHAAPWGTCHIGIADICTTAPHSLTDYQDFHLKTVVCENGERVSVGTITLDTGHAPRGLNARDTTAHYDNTGTAVADVCVGEDEHGIWVAGALRPDITAEQVRKLHGAVLSGDWREVTFKDGSYNLELVGLLAVNVPGFPIPRVRAMVAAGDDGELRVVALTAAGVHIGADENDQLEKIKAIANGEQFAALAARARREEA